MRRVGFLVNPIAGMGGRVGLKGTDGVLDEARRLGANPRAPDRGVEALRSISRHGSPVEILTWGGDMGEHEAESAGVDYRIVGRPNAAETTSADTREAVQTFVQDDVDLVLFVGGDGTAVDVLESLDELEDEQEVPILGVPAGVKVFSSVFAVSPEAAGRIAATYETTETREVNDIDEGAYRDGDVKATLRGLASVPVDADLQSSKQVLGGDVMSLARGVADDVEPGVTYVLGPGGTLDAIKAELGVEGSPLGVDVYRDGELILADASEAEILDSLGTNNVIVVSPIGGQGFVFGRGNDQLSPAVIDQCDLEIVASREKLNATGVLRVDSGDDELDRRLRGWVNVRIGKYEHRMIQIV